MESESRLNRYKGPSVKFRAPVGMRCFYCNDVLTDETATWDHLIPVSLGGPTKEYNLVSSCRKCNQLKSQDLPTEAQLTQDRTSFEPRDDHHREGDIYGSTSRDTKAVRKLIKAKRKMR